MRVLKLALIIFLTVPVLFSCQRDEDIVQNHVPIANAGPSQNVTLPTTVTLTGSGTDADGQVVAYLWSQVAGPNTALIANPGAATTNLSGLAAGNYIFQLMVTDNDGATGVDTMSLKVIAAPEVTLTLQPANNPTDFALVQVGSTDGSSNGWPDIPLASWTNGGSPVTIRSLLKFDLTSIPQTATIVSANLYLYSIPVPLEGNFIDANFGVNNAVTIQRVATNWSPTSTTWANQPSGIATGAITVPHTASSFLDLNIDVTSLASSMVSTNTNYGFLLKLQNEVTYTSRQFVSSHNANYAAKYPKFVIVYRP